MAKKAVAINKEYLEAKIKDLEEKKEKVLNLIDQYTNVYKKLEGAVEVLVTMIEDTKDKEEAPKSE